MTRYRAKLTDSEEYHYGDKLIHDFKPLQESPVKLDGLEIDTDTLEMYRKDRWESIFNKNGEPVHTRINDDGSFDILKINGKPLEISGTIDMPEIKTANIDVLGEPKTFTIPANGLCSDEDLPDLEIEYTPNKGRFPHGTVFNSCHQINQQFQAGKDRNDVDKAFDEWMKLPEKYYDNFEAWAKAFAVFFSERVKGGPL